MHALRNVHRLLDENGIVLDLHPAPPSIRVHAGGQDVGPLNARRWFRTVRRTEQELEKTVREGLFELETKLLFGTYERYPSLDDVHEALETWEGASLSKRVLARLERAQPPIDFHYRLTLRRYRAAR